MYNKQTSSIKRAQRMSLLFREISQLVTREKADNPALEGVMLTRVTLSPDGSICNVYFVTDKDRRKEAVDTLICYKPSLRKAIASSLQLRHVPDIFFRFDEQFLKQAHIESVIDRVAAQEKAEAQATGADQTESTTEPGELE
ncbi:MAG: Ribosome-binding factor A [candidate division TM6 bacterium GW2011_GWE2_41_16]|nr:MAG: Ribosome-binding factor A [candidate division TM6 bacterium GW2011_GWE2_41_16]